MLMYWKNRAVMEYGSCREECMKCSEMKMESELWKSCY